MIFTPRIGPHKRERLQMEISPEDNAKTSRGKKWSAQVTDLNTDKTYRVAGASCGSPRCFCDAIIIRECSNATAAD